jgi:hypothetical protein
MAERPISRCLLAGRLLKPSDASIEKLPPLFAAATRPLGAIGLFWFPGNAA